jgi:hypothetical protein
MLTNKKYKNILPSVIEEDNNVVVSSEVNVAVLVSSLLFIN